MMQPTITRDNAWDTYPEPGYAVRHGWLLVGHAYANRQKAADEVRKLRNIRRSIIRDLGAFGRLDGQTRERVLLAFRADIEGVIIRAMPRLAKPRDMYRVARVMFRVARDSERYARGRPCGEDDFILEGASLARAHARCLITYARALRGRKILPADPPHPHGPRA